MDESVIRVATRIKKWRGEAALSLQQLASRSGVSPSTIHKIEHNQTIPTIAVVLKLATGLGRHATELFDEEDCDANTIVVRADERNEVITPRGAQVQALAGELDATEVGLWRMVQPPGFSFGNDSPGRVNGELILLVEEGRLAVTVGEQHLALEAGDSLHLEASSAYHCKNDSERPATVLLAGHLAQGVRPSLLTHMRRFGTPHNAVISTGPDVPIQMVAAEA